jgi:glycosyltransferase involved in cell wall biosynthesis
MSDRVSADRGVTLVLPLQDEEQTVRALLRSVALQRHPPNEVLLVDAGSRDATIEIAATVEMPCPLRIIRTSRVFPGVARNEGVCAAGFEWIAFTDGGIVLDPDWLRELMTATTEQTDVVFGGMDPICDSFFSECAAVAYVSPKDGHGIRGPFIASSVMRRPSFLKVGGFPPYRAAEDLILVKRLRAAGAVVSYAPRALVRWQIAGSASATLRRFASYSHHNLLADWGRHWHLGVARLYGLLTLAVVASYFLGVGSIAGLGLPMFFLARAAKAAWAKRRSFEFSTLHPLRVLGAAGLLVIIDAATATGVVRWLFARNRS